VSGRTSARRRWARARDVGDSPLYLASEEGALPQEACNAGIYAPETRAVYCCIGHGERRPWQFRKLAAHSARGRPTPRAPRDDEGFVYIRRPLDSEGTCHLGL